MYRFLISLMVWALFAVDAAAGSTWIVDQQGGPGFHFTEIGEAIQSSLTADGDTILVRPGNFTYSSFVLNKGILVLSEDPAIRFTVSDPLHPVAMIRGISEATGPAGILGMEIPGKNGRLIVTNCPGTVMVENVLVDGSFSVNATTESDNRLLISNSQNVLLTSSSFFGGIGGTRSVEAAAKIENSTVQMDQVFIWAAKGADGDLVYCDCSQFLDGSDGDHGIEILDSTLTISGSKILGGWGGNGGCEEFGSPPVTNCGNAGHGGSGALIRNSNVTFLGNADPEHILLGGRGGSATLTTQANPTIGGDGGWGMDVDPTSVVIHSRLGDFAGGGPGPGDLWGREGGFTSGPNPTFQFLPFLSLPGPALRGGVLNIEFDAGKPGPWFLLAGNTYPLHQPLFLGPFPTDGFGRASIPGNIPADSTLLGLPLMMEAWFLDGGMVLQFSNPVFRFLQ